MSELTNIHARAVKDLTTPTELPVDTDALDQVKLVAGNFPPEYAGNEAMTVGMIKELAAEGREEEIQEVIQQITELENNSKEYVDNQLSLKAPQATTYTKTEVDNALSTKAPQATTYTKVEVDTKFSAYVGGRKAYTTLALAQAAQSSLPANTAIEVTNDPTAANNGTYQWNGTTLTKSSYDPLTQAKADATTKANNAKSEAIASSSLEAQALTQNALSMIGEQPLRILDVNTNTTAGFYNAVGVWNSSQNYSTSDFIEVKKGECLLLHHVNINTALFSRVVLFDAAKNLQGSLNNSVISDLNALSHDTKINLGFNSSEIKKNQNVGVIIPADGFIKITRSLLVQNSSDDLSNFFAAIVTQDTLIESTFVQSVPEGLIKELKQKWFTPEIDQTITKNGEIFLNPVSSGQTQTYGTASIGNRFTISKRYAVKRGQFVHVVGITHGARITAKIVDANEVALQNVDIASPFSVQTLDATTPNNYFNVEVLQDGFIRVAQSVEMNCLRLVAITDSPIFNIEKYYPYVESGTDLIEYSNLRPRLWMNIQGFKTYGSRQTTAALDTGVVDFALTTTGTSLVTGNKPIVLKKGDVLAFTSKTVVPTYARIYTVGNPLLGGISTLLNDPARSPVSEQSVNSWVAWANTGFDNSASPTWLNQAQETTNYICNEDHDLIIYLFTGNATTENNFGSENGGTIDVLSIDEYKRIRDLKMQEGLKPSLMNVLNDYTRSSTSSESVLVFKNEVVEFFSNQYAYSAVPTSNYFDGSITLSVTSILGQVTYTIQHPSKVLKYSDYVSREISSAVKVRTTALFHISFLDFYTEEGIYAASQRYNSENSNMVFRVIESAQQLKDRVKLSSTLIGLQYLQLRSDAEGQYLLPTASMLGTIDTRAAYVEAGKYYAITSMGMKSAWFVPTGISNVSRNTITDLVPNVAAINKTLAKHCFSPEVDGIVYWETYTGERTGISTSRFENIPTTEWFLKDHFDHNIYEITQSEFDEFTHPYSLEFLDLPDDGTINFNFLSRMGQAEVESIVQIRTGETAFATVRAVTANQGQSSLLYPKKNINFEFLSKDGEDLFLRFGDKIEEPEMVAKSYFGSDRSHTADSTSADIWHEMRTFKPYPTEGVIPKSVLSNTTYDLSRHKARGITFGIPLEIYSNGKFLGTYTLRSKKKRANYAMKKKEKNHILLQADYTLPGAAMFFRNMKLSSTEVRNPELTNYVAGDTTLSDTTVQADIQRIFDWMSAAIANPALYDSEGSQYIDFNSWYDYTIHTELVRNWDGLMNNYLIGTWDSKVWHVFPYDLDHTISVTDLAPYGLYLTDLATLYSASAPNSRTRFLKRYAEMRNTKVISIENMTKILRRHFDKINTIAATENNKKWGITLPDYQQIDFMVDWFYKRIRYLDAAWGYLPSDSIILRTIDIPSTSAGGIRNYTYTGTTAQVGDVLKVEYGNLPLGMTVTANCTVAGTVVVTYTNTTSETINPDASFIRVYKES